MLGSIIHIQNYPAFFISYDEPNADDNFKAIKSLVPNINRVHGIKGIHNAHKKCAVQTDDWFWTIDGDNYPLDQLQHAHVILDNAKQLSCIHSFRTVNDITGLIYGNGSVKLWRKQFLDKVSHETTTDFFYNNSYWICSDILAITKSASSDYHAFRSAYREVAKLTLTPDGNLQYKLNLNDLGDNGIRLKLWLTMGNHLQYGKFSLLGAHAALTDFYINNKEILLINDYDRLLVIFEYWAGKTIPVENSEKLLNCKLPILDAETSLFFRNCQFKPTYNGLMK
jgi:hypothetical protein